MQTDIASPVRPADALGATKQTASKVAETRYVVITPVRDEEAHIAELVESVAAQTVRPVEWVVVDDGSTDRTGAILDRCAEKHPWMRVIHRTNRGFRKSGGGVVQAFYDGYKTLQASDWAYVVKLDGDLTFAPDYFESCFERFARDPRLGIGGGGIYHEFDGQMHLESGPKFHVRGATKIYSRACWEAIGGLWTAAGWDTIDEVKANMLGWTTYSFPELRLHHHRVTGAAEGIIRDRVKHGEVCYVSGYHPLFVLASCLFRLRHKPYVTGSAAILWGFIRAHWTHPPRVEDRAYRRYIRGQQLRRLAGMETIWR